METEALARAEPRTAARTDLGVPDAGIKPRSLALQADSLPVELPGKPIARDIVGTENEFVE